MPVYLEDKKYYTIEEFFGALRKAVDEAYKEKEKNTNKSFKYENI